MNSNDTSGSDEQAGDRLLDEFDLTQNISHLLRRAHFRAEAIFKQEMAGHELTPRQKALLLAARQRPGATVNELAKQIALDRNSTAEMLGRLVQQGLLEKTPAPTDKRASAVHITEDGSDLLRTVMRDDQHVEDRIVEPLPEEYRPLFRKCLRIMNGLEE
ncbi:MarR family winged helix-turn-helix transcriptional regulator [Streptomyces sp. NBC_00006]|uniref:MarR family winged helix-turn-helix transcriptional regulator n=1 Tax=unclassified Streptomyces TaxID=2593676 RepID=UPI00225B4FDA|nr:MULTISPECIES: MarR family winged helix-turn-helix transcriptional regulator [unclassified Streptomyces]MCX5529730.1 MarR family winged helix-turn-helix transcriptional regulator [Streptomyces sp. NBC_00006]